MNACLGVGGGGWGGFVTSLSTCLQIPIVSEKVVP